MNNRHWQEDVGRGMYGSDKTESVKSDIERTISMYGLFITFEGPDGGGKTTQLHLLKEALEQRNCEVVLTREPGGTLISDQIRRILLHPNSKHMRAETEVLLYAASRA